MIRKIGKTSCSANQLKSTGPFSGKGAVVESCPPRYTTRTTRVEHTPYNIIELVTTHLCIRGADVTNVLNADNNFRYVVFTRRYGLEKKKALFVYFGRIVVFLISPLFFSTFISLDFSIFLHHHQSLSPSLSRLQLRVMRFFFR